MLPTIGAGQAINHRLSLHVHFAFSLIVAFLAVVDGEKQSTSLATTKPSHHHLDPNPNAMPDYLDPDPGPPDSPNAAEGSDDGEGIYTTRPQ